MQQDKFGGQHATTSVAAVEAFEAAVYGVAAHRPGGADSLAQALAHDPHLVAAHALKGFAAVILGRAELGAAARQAHADALMARLARGRVTPSEAALTDALGFAIEGRLLAAADRLDAHLDESPREFLAAKLANALRFMMGDADGMLLGTARVLDAWSEEMPGYGFLLGCHAFALEERGELEAAERIGRRAVALAPEDAWGLHAVSHVHETQGRVEEGIAWIEAKRPVWSACNNFSFHMAWHLALFHLERGEHERVLALYDSEVRPSPTDDFRDMANAVSLLWRLEQDGVAVGDRWDALRAIAVRRQDDTTLTFAALHNLLALVASGDGDAAERLAGAMEARADCVIAPEGEADQAVVLRSVGCDLARAILRLRRGGRGAGPALGRLAARLPRIGGSHAQRDVFLRTLAALAADQGDRDALDQVLAVRRRLRRDDRFAARLGTRLAARGRASLRLTA
ncbi:MAG: tetratricopeptide repeat protein [Methylobacteriaceae bacterium]|nr:tetratricopeptide repeat protein [Methylobacteriaceae bacterium]